MNVNDTRAIVARISGYWPTPAMTPEEVVAWVTELTSRPMNITPDEATTVVTATSRHGNEFRPRPGQMVADVQALRHRRALERPVPALPSAVDFGCDHDEVRRMTLASCREILAAAMDGAR